MVCALCGRNFQRIQALRAHERIVHQVEPDGSARMAATALSGVSDLFAVMGEVITTLKAIQKNSVERDKSLSDRLDIALDMDKKLMRCVLDLKEMVGREHEAVQPE